ncbi:hypothetical protein [Actinomadura verrucosospora]|uniref:Uncharacterized protein n=1 Tax=Actinomadura verrucosospora TaxID=46165 RepID=A0A7D3ZL06_ACTVE|nr:hypothetical protein [Actinomadura verrucosospora]QKG21083.1 hypothetical protein ACTIVE_2721 [Actinomadura verrucosospora]
MSNITELSKVEFRGSLGEAFKTYGQELEALADRWKTELEIAAVDAEAAMGTMKGHLLLFGLDSKIRARRVAKRLKRAQDLAASVADSADQFHRSYRKHFKPS